MPSSPGQHCPFLNRSDPRCAGNFSLDRLGHALRHCFGQYAACPTYVELLVERRARRSGEGAFSGEDEVAAAVPDAARGNGRDSHVVAPQQRPPAPAKPPIVSLFIRGRRHAGRAADRAA